MSGAACAKKRACNPPVKAAVETADGMVEIIVEAVKAGDLSDADGDALILEFAASDDRYVAEQKAIQKKVIESLGGLPATQRQDNGRGSNRDDDQDGR